MKAKMYSQKAHSDLFHHIIDGFETTFEGEFKIMNGLISIFFAALFCTMQVNGEDLEVRRTARARTRTTTSRTKSRKE